MNDHFGVRARLELVAECFKFGAQFAEIVNLTIENDGECALFIPNRLAAARKINNTEAAHAQRGTRSDQQAFVVRAAVNHCRIHPPDEALRIVEIFEADCTANAAHTIRSP